VPVDVDEGAGGDVHYVTEEQDPDRSPKVCVSTCADEGKARFNHLNPCVYFRVSEFIIAILCAFTFRG
jgi:hypothetical protein